MEKYFYSEPDDFWCITIYISNLDDDLKISLNDIFLSLISLSRRIGLLPATGSECFPHIL